MLKSLTFTLFACFIFSFSIAQEFTYTLTVTAEPYDDLTGTVSLNNGEVWDEPIYLVPIGFPFQLNGHPISFFQFAGSGSGMTSETDDPDVICALLPFETDLIDRGIESGVSESPISYKVEGTTGSRIQKIEFKNAGSYYEHQFSGTVNMAISFQCWLYEGSNKVEFRFGENTIDDNFIFYGGGGAVVGLTDFNTSEETFLNAHLLGGPADAPYLSMSDVTIEGTPSNGAVYRLTPLQDLEVTVTGEDGISACGPDASATANATGGIEPYSYEWNNGETTQTIDGLTSGTYTVTVTDDVGTSTSGSVVVSNALPFEVDVETTHETGAGANDGTATATTSGGSPPYAYEWSNGETTATIEDLAPGTYFVTVTESSGCTAIANGTVNSFGCPELFIEGGTTNVTCLGECDGRIEILDVINGIAPFEYMWSNGDENDLIENLCPGSYTVTVTDEDGCVGTQDFTISEPGLLQVNAGSTNETGDNTNDGTAWATPVGGTAPYSYLWNNASTDSLIVGLSPGAYTVTVTDANACQNIQTVVVEDFGCGTIQAGIQYSQCFGQCAASIEATLPEGETPLTWVWSNDSTTSLITGLCPGNYDVTITDAGGCVATASYFISEPEEVQANVSSTNESAPGVSDGTAWAVPSGGTPPYTYAWSNGSTDSLITGLTPGVYTLILTDVNLCGDTQSVAVNPFECLGFTESFIESFSCTDSCKWAITTFLIDGVGPFTYSWSTGSTQIPTINNLCPGSYGLTIVDQGQGCTFVETIVVFPSDELIAIVDEVVHITDSTSSSISISVLEGTPPLIFAWYGPGGYFSGDEDVSNLPAGFYSVQISNGLGCTIIDSIEIKDLTTGLQNILSTPVHFYPNPASDEIVIDAPELEAYTISLWSNDGRKIKTWPVTDRIDVSDVAPGLYVLKIMSGEQFSAHRVMIDR